ncbi:hypothetical protein L3X38_008401 [Prunus dulcis]|uniref:Uncharacterized protein n=1 Tax=Prunus dulcis TaxID=3755 RepID=A0AAD4ZWU9_PRUDU|nr:hypothetical protein L3X38_008401 [Prunus dulcis]
MVRQLDGQNQQADELAASKEVTSKPLGYKFTKPEHPLEVEPKHPPEIAAAPSKARAAINLKILINGKDLNTAMAEDATATPKAPKALKATPIKLKISMNDKDIALAMAEAAELRHLPPSQS